MDKIKERLMKAPLAYLCFAWAVFLLLGIAVGLNWPFVLAVVGTALYLLG